MKYSVAIASLILFTAPAFAVDRYDPPLNTSVDLLEWCQQESQATFIGKGITPFNWSASYWDKAGTLFVKGSWRVDDKEVIVECRAGQGARRSYAVMTMHDAT